MGEVGKCVGITCVALASAATTASQWYLTYVYTSFPPRTLSASALRDRLAAVGKLRLGSKGVLHELRKLQVATHPDKNRQVDYGAEWAVRAVELSKLTGHLIDECKKRNVR